jgi:hypothetical protein
VSYPQGIRLNNPCNLRYDSTAWQGLADPPSEHGFCVFADPIHGLRAAMVNLKNYQIFHDINTIERAIERHAPSSENPTRKYIEYISSQTGFSPDAVLDFSDRRYAIPVIKAMARFENGPEYVTYVNDIYEHAADAVHLT